MVLFCCDSKRNGVLTAVVASLVIGIVTALLRITGVITLTSAFLWVTFGVAVGYLALILIASLAFRCSTHCMGTGSPLSALLAGILGTLLVSVILLAISFAVTSFIGAILTGALAFFFALLFTATACLIKCLVTNCE